MKKICLAIVTALLLTACKKDNSPTIPVNQFIKDNYTEDAKQLLFRMLQNGTVTADKDKAEFNQNEIDKILSGIQAVYNLKNTYTDTIFTITPIHIFPHTSLKAISIHADNTKTEGQKILAHQPTGNADYDNLLSKYGFTYTGSTTLPNYGYAEIINTTTYNLSPIVTALKGLPFIIDAQQDGSIGDGNDITYTLNGLGIDIDFIHKYGDCPAGCGARHAWRFHINVADNYKATYVKTYN